MVEVVEGLSATYKGGLVGEERLAGGDQTGHGASPLEGE